jgi:hypothetical protein
MTVQMTDIVAEMKQPSFEDNGNYREAPTKIEAKVPLRSFRVGSFPQELTIEASSLEEARKKWAQFWGE